jgi:class 3 adenylate cyclase/tetratricopeptide (TPR) repeat protein
VTQNESLAADLSNPGRKAASDLVSFVPRLTLEWLRRDPARSWLELEGTLAFVDISGFTAMSERLSSLGRAGAEEVTDVMNATFAALLDVAYAEGGGLLKFGGDALLLLYEGDDHAAHAARATFEMRRTLRMIGRPRTSGGVVSLRMHAGLHSGGFHFFLVGDTHRELLVAGPGATRAVEMESASEAGDILLSPETAARLRGGEVGDAKGPGRLLRARPETRGTLAPQPSVDGIPLEIAVPAPLRTQLLEVGPLEGEHRNAAIAFVRFAGINDLIATEGAAAAAEALDVLVRTIQAAAAEHGVTFLESDVDSDGGRIILVAGAPQTFGDDEERLLRTLHAMVASALPLTVHVGASRGRVFTGQVGAPFRRTYTLLGDTAALAARLMARAGEGEIYVTTDAFSRGGGKFVGTELEPFAVKGKAEPVRAILLGSLAGAAEDGGTAEKLPFVDRERERAVLGASVAPVRMGFGSLVELVGEPGIGKSRLAEELRTSCADLELLTARCEQYESSTPYHPFRPLLWSLLGVELNGGAAHNQAVLTERLRAIDAGLVPWAPLLAAPLDADVESTPEVDELDPSFRRARLHGLVGSLLGLLLDSPTVLLFEDVHWMDDASSELLRHLGTQLSTRPWLVCTTRRPDGGGFAANEGTPPLPALTLRLEPLPAEDAKDLLRAATKARRLNDEELSAIAERAAGNPLFLQELAVPDEAAATADELPESVEALVATRIDRLAPGDRALLRWASVLGVSFSGAAIADVLAGDPTAAADSEAWDRLAEFVERDPEVPNGFRFRHALIRDAAYNGLSFRRRRELHGRIADVIAQRRGDDPAEAVELLSLHFHRGGRAPETWRYSLLAGRRAQAKWANLEAAEFYERALDASKDLPQLDRPEVARTWEALGDCLQLAGRLEAAADAFREARALVPKDSAGLVELMNKEGSLREEMGRYADAIRWYGRGLKAVDRLPESSAAAHLRAELSMGYAEARFRQGEFADCIKRCRSVVEQALEIDDMSQLAAAYLLLHLVHTQTGSPDRRAFRGLALPIFEDLGDLKGQATVLNNLGIESYYDGDWKRALDVYERSRDLFRRIGDVTNVAMATNNIGEIRSDQGHLEEAARLFAEVRDSVDAAGQRLLSAVARLNLGRVAARAGRFDEAKTLIAEAADAFHEIRAASFAQEARVRLAEAAVLEGDHELALDETELAGLASEANRAPAVLAVLHRVRGYAHLQSGRPEEAAREFESSLGEARRAGAAYEEALSLQARARLRDDGGDAAEARALLEALQVVRVPEIPV